MHYFDENGATVSNVWRTEDYGTMQSTQSNAAMDGQQGNMNNGNMNGNMHNQGNQQMNQGNQSDLNNQQGTQGVDNQMHSQSDIDNSQTSDMNNQATDGTRAKDGKSKYKTKRSTDNRRNQ
jgi:hypothetical protein